MASSLYRVLAQPATDGGPVPGTLKTKQIETVDNDQAAFLGANHLGPVPPGTRFTASYETVDNDVAIVASTLHTSSGNPHPPGTAITATVVHPRSAPPPGSPSPGNPKHRLEYLLNAHAACSSLTNLDNSET